jgi:hypothetical protein
MRSSKPSAPSASEIRESYLGEIAPLLDAARRMDSLSPERKRVVRRRILRTTFGTGWLALRMRPAAVALALAALVVGGVAFAAAERLGLMSGIGKAPAVPPTIRARSEGRHMPVGAKPLSSDQVVLPKVPDPLLLALPAASTFGWRVSVDGVAADAVDALAEKTPLEAASGTRGLLGKRARSVPRWIAYTAPVPVTPAPANEVFVPPLPGSGQAVTPVFAPSTVPPVGPAVVPSPAVPGPFPARQVVPGKDNLRSIPSDPVLFGQAMRKLRLEHDPSSALTALLEHARAYPRSGLSAERDALEVESLLALRRDREALSRLDGMALDTLPRGGERLVVRGELRAAARRWPEASADFDQALSRVSGSPAWHERALWGRAVARLRCGEREAGLADLETYRDRYPDGRFALEAARFLDRR